MRKQTYLMRKGAKYHFRRRIASDYKCKRSISIALNTAEPAVARHLATRLAARWDEVAMYIGHQIERGTLSLAEQEALYREALEDELAKATADITAPIGGAPPMTPVQSKLLETGYRIVGRVPAEASEPDPASIEAEIDDSWTKEELALLDKVLRLIVTPGVVARSEIQSALRKLGAPANEGTLREARSHILRGRAEAQRRRALLDHPAIAGSGKGVMALLDDALVAAAMRGDTGMQPLAAGAAAYPHPFPYPPYSHPHSAPDECIYRTRTTLRFSDVMEEVLEAVAAERDWDEDDGQRERIAQTFAWITGDKVLSDYREEDVDYFTKMMRRIPKKFKWGKLYESGAMAEPFDEEQFSEKPAPDQKRSPRTINRDLTVLAAMSEQLAKSHWKLRYGKDLEMDFLDAWIRVVNDPNDPKRPPWTPEHLRTMYDLPLWQGGGGSGNRLKPARSPEVYQDAAFWVPLLGTCLGLAREEACGLEVEDFNFECEVPYLVIRANMTRSKDGVNPAGLKNLHRYRIMPLHSELLRLGLKDYVEAVAKEQGYTVGTPDTPIFPELYSREAKWPSTAEPDPEEKPQLGGRRFYAIAWCYIMDATHAVMPLPETRKGKKTDFHSQRTYNQSVLASPDVSQTIIDKHMGHAMTGTGPRNYNRRALALGEVKELRERLDVLHEQMPDVTSHIERPARVRLMHISKRSRVGSAPGRNAKQRFCE